MDHKTFCTGKYLSNGWKNVPDITLSFHFSDLIYLGNMLTVYIVKK